MSNPAIHQTILQQQLQRQQDSAAARMKFPMMVGVFTFTFFLLFFRPPPTPPVRTKLDLNLENIPFCFRTMKQMIALID